MSNQKNELLIDENPSSDFLLRANDEPVWPVRNRLELKALQSITNIFGSSIKKVSGNPGTSSPDKETVVGLGYNVKEAGLLYAHLTQRRYRTVSSLKELNPNRLPAVVITNTGLLNKELLELLYNSEKVRTQVTGVICADDPQLLRKQVLVRAAASHLSGHLEFIRVDVSPGRLLEHKKVAGHEIIGGNVASEEMRSALGRGAGLLSLKTHSDGIDALLIKDLTLCSMSQLQIKPGTQNMPVCQETRFCHRHEAHIDEVLQSGKVLSPEAIAARIFVFESCFGLLLPGGIIDFGWSLGHRFLVSDTIGAIITTWGLTYTGGVRTKVLTQNLLKGMPVGAALALYNVSDGAKKYGNNHRMCLLGDPRVKLPPQEFNRMAIKHYNSPGKSKKPEVAEIRQPSEVEFFEACFTNLLNTASDEQKRKESKVILAKLEACKTNFEKKSPDDSVNLELRTAILNFILGNPQVFRAWLDFADEFANEDSAKICPSCDQSAISFRKIGMKLSQKFQRRIEECINCGMLEDSPADVDLKFSYRNKVIELHGEFPRRRCSIGVLLAASRVETAKLTVPMDEDGFPPRRFQTPDFNFRSTIRIHLIIVWDDNYAVLTKLMPSFQKNSE